MDPLVVDWEQQDYAEVRPGIFGATLHTDQLTATLYRYAGASSWEEHQHPQDQMTYVISGEVDFVVAGRAVRLRQGQFAALPGGTPHAATVKPGPGAVTLNVFTRREAPPSVG